MAGRAAIAALDGRGVDALAAYREALRAYRVLGLAFDEAAAVVDVATLLPAAERHGPEVATLVTAAKATLERLGAEPFLERLDSGAGAITPRSGGPPR